MPPTRPGTFARWLPAALAVALFGAAFAGFTLLAPADDASRRERAMPPCEVPREVLQRVWRGYVPRRSGDVLAIERPPNQFGDRHSTPWPYTQDVPLVLYGPGFIRRGGGSDRAVTVADLAPTFAELLAFDEMRQRDGRALSDALLPRTERNGIPKLLVTVVWDGGGDNVLRRWPDSWPELKRLMQRGANYAKATVGSSPSITPAVHATIGTGLFPARHGIPDIKVRIKGRITDAWAGTSPHNLRAETLADAYDAANDNRPLVGMLARDAWHLGMIGHGSYLATGDKDVAVLDDLGGIGFRTNPDYYSLPGYMRDTEGLEEAVDQVDRRDGELDRRWLGNQLLPYSAGVRYTPAFSIYQTQRILQLLTNEGFGADDIPDLFYTNYKAPDLAGHEWNMVEPEVGENIAEADRQLGVLIDGLNKRVGERNYVLAVTADHGMTPYPEVRGGWSINTRELEVDMERELGGTTRAKPLVLSNRGYQFMLDRSSMRRHGVTPSDVARFIRNYTLAENAGGEVPDEFADRANEKLYLAAFTPKGLRQALACADRSAQRARSSEIRSAATRARKAGLPKT